MKLRRTNGTLAKLRHYIPQSLLISVCYSILFYELHLSNPEPNVLLSVFFFKNVQLEPCLIREG